MHVQWVPFSFGTGVFSHNAACFTCYQQFCSFGLYVPGSFGFTPAESSSNTKREVCNMNRAWNYYHQHCHVLWCFTTFYSILSVHSTVAELSPCPFIVWSSSDPKDNFSIYPFVMNNKVYCICMTIFSSSIIDRFYIAPVIVLRADLCLTCCIFSGHTVLL